MSEWKLTDMPLVPSQPVPFVTADGAMMVQFVDLGDGTIGVLNSDNIIEGELIVDELAWLTAGPNGRALPLTPERLA